MNGQYKQESATVGTLTPNSDVRRVLDDRGKDYGGYRHMAEVAQQLKSTMRSGGCVFTSAQQESVDMICTKMARIACGNPGKRDTWVDIAGYATLISDMLDQEPCSPGA